MIGAWKIILDKREKGTSCALGVLLTMEIVLGEDYKTMKFVALFYVIMIALICVSFVKKN